MVAKKCICVLINHKQEVRYATVGYISILVLVGCTGPVITKFEALPEYVCVPGSSDISWNVGGTTPIDIKVRLDDTDSADGTISNLPHETTNLDASISINVPVGRSKLSLLATNREDQTSDDLILTGLGDEPQAGQMTFDPNCADDGTFGQWQSVDLLGFDPDISPTGVTNTTDRQILVTHADVARTLEPRETSSAWNGTALEGKWTVTADPLFNAPSGAELVTESCDPGLPSSGETSPTLITGATRRTIPFERLSVSYTFACN